MYDASWPRHRFCALVLASAALASPATLAADDRDLIRGASKTPNMFILLDTSGSMNWALTGGHYYGSANVDPNTAAVPGSADDPHSRGYQAKSAVHEVLKRLHPTTRLGFAHFASPNSAVFRKHWLYTPVAGTSLPWAGQLPFPLPGQPLRFGDQLDFGTGLGECGAPDAAFDPGPAPDNDRYRVDRMVYFPKLGADGSTRTRLVTERGGIAYGIEFAPLSSGQQLGDLQLDVEVEFQQCGSGSSQSATIRLEPAVRQDTQQLPIVGASAVLSQTYGTLGLPQVDDHGINPPCEGWEDNSGTLDGQLAYPTFADPLARGSAFDRGDVVPWDWVNHAAGAPPPTGFTRSTRDEILLRLAPNTATGAPTFASLGVTPPSTAYASGDVVPDFRIAPYFEDQPDGSGRLQLRAAFRDTPPFAFAHLTPLAAMLDDLRAWYTSWEAEAETDDPEFACRGRFAILLTDGVETCDGTANAPATAAGLLRVAGIQTFVVGFGPIGSGALQAIAYEGGTGLGSYMINEPGAPAGITKDCERFVYKLKIDTDGDLIPDTEVERNTCDDPDQPGDDAGVFVATSREALVAALTRIFITVRGDESAFAGASLPAQQAESADTIVLSSFTPLLDAPHWQGHLRNFVRPIPLLLDTGIPDLSATCPTNPSPSNPAVGCFAWDAGEAMGVQAPTPAEVIAGVLRLGLGQDERRLYWSRPPGGDQVPRERRWFVLPPGSELDARYDLWNGLELPFVVGDATSEAAAAARTSGVVQGVVEQKTGVHPSDDSEVPFILGDIFHSSPLFLGPPHEFTYARQNLYDNGEPCIEAGSLNPDTTGYRCFFSKHRQRRKVVVAGANDGQVHAFDAGRFDSSNRQFSIGTGRELFAYIPSPLLRRTRQIGEGASSHEYGADGSLQIADVFIDVVHGGTPTPAERQWRTVVVGGLREGGSGYFALDLTQPDPVAVVNGVEVPNDGGSGNYVQSCAGAGPSGGSGLTSGLDAACGPVPYGTALWEFGDQRDDDGDGAPDLGESWSQPNTGRIRVRAGTETVDKFVAVFGGGFDPGRPGSGSWLYLVDIETGHAIYKRPLIGAAAADAAAVDSNFDGYLDRVYLGTTAGIVYKVDLSSVVELVADATVPGGKTIVDPAWTPFRFFDTGARAIFNAPAVLFVGQKNRYALAFSTGNRDDLFTRDNVEGRFYVVLDDNVAAGDLPPSGLDESALHTIDAASTTSFDDLLLDPSTGSGTVAGYALRLAPNERGISRAFALAGVTVFSTFVPSAGSVACGGRGASRIYTLFTTSGNALRGSQRFRELDTFVTTPFTETSGVSQGNQTGNNPALPTDLLRVYELLKELMPGNCRFNNITIDIKLVREDTGIEFLAPVPVCVIQKNWKEF